MADTGLMIVILSALFFSSLTMTIALGIAWASFGHPRHALSWSFAFGLSALQSLVNFAALVSGRPPLLMALAFILVIAPSPFVAMGARQRAGLPSRAGWFVAAALAVTLFMVASAPVPALHPFSYSSATLFSSAALLVCARAIIPRDRDPEAAEWAMFLAVSILALVEFAAGLWTFAFLARPDDAHIAAVYHAILAVAAPPAVVAAGVSAILLLASDLAAELRRLAARDPLTGILNRRGFQEAALRALANARRHRQRAAVALCDIDHFKAINDRHGHGAGDETLVHVCRKLGRGVRAGDVVGRVGGEEFALLLVGAGDAAATIERIRLAVAGGITIGDEHLPLSASFGVAEIGGGPPEQALAHAFDAADRALYRSKTEGRNRTTLAEPEPSTPGTGPLRLSEATA